MDYKNAKIYKIVDLTNNNTYYGSTCSNLRKRLWEHENNFRSYLNGAKKYMSSYIILENNNYDIYLVEYFPCANKTELHRREGEYILNNNCVNQCVAGRTIKEYRQLDKYKNNCKLYDKRYRETHKEQIKDRDKIRSSTKILCECGTTIIGLNHFARHKRTYKHDFLMQEKIKFEPKDIQMIDNLLVKIEAN